MRTRQRWRDADIPQPAKPTWVDTAACVHWQAAGREALPALEQLIDDIGTCGRHLELAHHGKVLVRLTTRNELGIPNNGPIQPLIEAGLIRVLRGLSGNLNEQLVMILVDPREWRTAQHLEGESA